ncbi:putative clathrin assembly protein [Glycine max]|nr:putative clathrin assembly protein [Glycine max]
MDRLQETNNAAVVLKCLIAVHHGSFILQDQLSVYPSAGGRNYLNLSNFRHNTDPTSWELSSWVRSFAQHIEQLLCTSRILGFFLRTSTDSEDRVVRKLCGSNAPAIMLDVSTIMLGAPSNTLDSLVALIQRICKRLEPNNRLVEVIVNLALEDWDVVQVEVHLHEVLSYDLDRIVHQNCRGGGTLEE